MPSLLFLWIVFIGATSGYYSAHRGFGSKDALKANTSVALIVARQSLVQKLAMNPPMNTDVDASGGARPGKKNRVRNFATSSTEGNLDLPEPGEASDMYARRVFEFVAAVLKIPTQVEGLLAAGGIPIHTGLQKRCKRDSPKSFVPTARFDMNIEKLKQGLIKWGAFDSYAGHEQWRNDPGFDFRKESGLPPYRVDPMVQVVQNGGVYWDLHRDAEANIQPLLLRLYWARDWVVHRASSPDGIPDDSTNIVDELLRRIDNTKVKLTIVSNDEPLFWGGFVKLKDPAAEKTFGNDYRQAVAEVKKAAIGAIEEVKKAF